MKSRWTSIMAWVLTPLIAVAALAGQHAIVESWIRSGHGHGAFQKVAIIGLSDDRSTRHHFEDKFVSHLRGRGYQSLASHSLVPDLKTMDDLDRVLTAVAEQRIDSAISVRLVPLGKMSEEEWSDSWNAAIESDGTLRSVMAEPYENVTRKSRRHGVEISLWSLESRQRVWAGRTDRYKLKQLRKNTGEFIEYTVTSIKKAGLLR